MDTESKAIVKFAKADKKSIEQFYTEKYNYIYDIVKSFPRKNTTDEEGRVMFMSTLNVHLSVFMSFIVTRFVMCFSFTIFTMLFESRLS